MNSQFNRADEAAGIQLMPYQSLPEEMNEDMAKAAAARDSIESYGIDYEGISYAQRLIGSLRPCRHLDNMNYSSLPQVNHSVQDFVGLASTSGSPLSTTTS